MSPNLQPGVTGQTSVNLRSTHPIGTLPDLLLFIPGGPGISSRYLDPFLGNLGLESSWNVAILDLPGHGHSGQTNQYLPKDYPGLQDWALAAVRSVLPQHRRLILCGQSLGGRLVLDLLPLLGAQVAGAIAIGAPIRFESSKVFDTRLSQTNVDFTSAVTEASFAQQWRRMLPLYFHRPLHPKEVEDLSDDTCFLSTGHLIENAPALKPDPTEINFPLLLLQGANDIVVPDENLDLLGRSFPSARIASIPEAGHFPMLEQASVMRQLIREFISEMSRGTS